MYLTLSSESGGFKKLIWGFVMLQKMVGDWLVAEADSFSCKYIDTSSAVSPLAWAK